MPGRKVVLEVQAVEHQGGAAIRFYSQQSTMSTQQQTRRCCTMTTLDAELVEPGQDREYKDNFVSDLRVVSFIFL